MKTLIIYTSQTGFTKKYSQWLADRLHADLYDLKDVKKKEAAFFDAYEAIVYGGWIMAGKVTGSKWFLEKAGALKKRKDEKLREVGERISQSYDISDIKYIDPIVSYLQEGEQS